MVGEVMISMERLHANFLSNQSCPSDNKCYHCSKHSIFKECDPIKCSSCPRYKELENIKLKNKNLQEWLNNGDI
jgi:hypothetical protein